jgi:hypothetical protein
MIEDPEYTHELYENYVKWFNEEFADDLCHPAPYEFWVSWNRAMDESDHPLEVPGVRTSYTQGIERAAKAEWTRCRSSADRKSGITWEELTESTRDAWRKGALNAIEAFYG